MKLLRFSFSVVDNAYSGILIDRPDTVTGAALATRLYNQWRTTIEEVDFIVVRPAVDSALTNVSGEIEELGDLIRRAPNAAIYILYSTNYEIRISDNINPSALISASIPASPESVSRFIETIKASELESLVKNSTALFRAKDNYWYRTPSDRLVRQFFRVGSTQTHRGALDAYFFWMLPWLKTCGAILAETWSISSLALNASRLLQRYDPDNKKRVRVDMLSEYHDGNAELARFTNEAIERIAVGADDNAHHILVLISATHTGNSLRRLQDTIRAGIVDETNFSFLTLFRLIGTDQTDCLHDASKWEDADGFLPQERPTTGPGSNNAIVDIDRTTYFPLRIYEGEVCLDKSSSKHASDTLGEYQNLGVFSVHRDIRDLNDLPLRHHGIYVDVAKMLPTNRFKQRLDQILQSMKPPRLIVAPDHAAAKLLAEYAKQYFAQHRSADVEMFLNPDLNKYRLAQPLLDTLSAIAETETILVLDDVTIRGTRLRGYAESLRNLPFKGHIHYVIGVARAPTAASFALTKRDVQFRAAGAPRHSFECVEDLTFMPDLDRNDCPWCAEMFFHQQLASASGISAQVLSASQKRLERLLYAKTGLIDDAFWKWSEQQPFILEDNSVFLKKAAGEADTFVAVSCSLQRMRADPESTQRLEFRYPHIAVLRNADLVNYSDSVIRASIFRAVNVRDIQRWTDAQVRQQEDVIRQLALVPRSHAKALHHEILFAITSRKLHKVSLSEGELRSLEDDECSDLVTTLLSQRA
jgi:hypothetical protein